MKLQKLFKKLLLLNVLTLFSLSLISQNVSAMVTKHADVVFVGEFGSGKTAITSRLHEEVFDYGARVPGQFADHLDLKDTLGLNDDVKVQCTIWDTPGNVTMRDQIMKDYVTTANVVVVVIDAATGNPQEVVMRAFTEWLPKIKEKNSSARILFVLNKLDIPRSKGTAVDVLTRCSGAIDSLGNGDMSALYISSKDDYCISRSNENVPGSVRENLLKSITDMLRPDAGKLPAAKLGRIAVCPKCGKECPPDEMISGKCRDCRRHVCSYKKCNGSSAPSICYEGEGSFTWGDKGPYCSYSCRDNNESCLIM